MAIACLAVAFNASGANQTAAGTTIIRSQPARFRQQGTCSFVEGAVGAGAAPEGTALWLTTDQDAPFMNSNDYIPLTAVPVIN